MLEPFFNKVVGLKETPTQVFSCEICEIFKNSFFNRTPPVEIDNEARISKEAEMKRKFNRNQKRITL